MKRSTATFAAAACSLAPFALATCAPVEDSPSTNPPAMKVTPFVETAAQAGLDFVHFNGMSGKLYIAEMMGAGVALLDFDRDGDLDVYLVQGSMLGEAGLEDALLPPRHAPPLTDRLYRNELVPAGALRFADVTREVGLAPAPGYGMGVATGDYDRDGDVDLYVTRFGPNQLLRNDRGERFVDVTAASGSDDRRWSVAAAFADFDRDGWLDLYVGNFVDFSLASHRPCQSEAGWPDYCGPLSYRPQPDRLLRGSADGTFRDDSLGSGIRAVAGNTLGAIPNDFDGDGWLDLYVANDSQPNFLWRNQRDGRFVNVAEMAGAAVNDKGQAEASMGVDAGDMDGDGDEDFFMSHLTLESNTLYENVGDGLFLDRSAASGLGVPSVPYTGFGTVFFDYDLDGVLDVYVANGAINRQEDQLAEGDPLALRQPDQLFRGLGGGLFAEVEAPAGDLPPAVGRGAGVGDVDNDGDPDLLVTGNTGAVRLLLNQGAAGAHWVGLRVVDGPGGSDSLGAWVGVRTARESRWRRVRTAGSYASASDPRVLVGLGVETAIDGVEVRWPSGETELFRGVPIDRYSTLARGRGEALGAP
jgi:hypothetical protein